MKKITFLFVMTILPCLIFGQTALEIQKSKTSVKAYLIKRLNNPSSYQSASWSKLTKTYSSYDDSKTAKAIRDSIELYDDGKFKAEMLARRVKNDNYSNYEKDSSYVKYTSLASELEVEIDRLKKYNEAKEKSYKGIFTGYSIDHSFRSRNKFNALVLANWVFILDKNLKVIDSGDIDEIAKERQRILDQIDALSN